MRQHCSIGFKSGEYGGSDTNTITRFLVVLVLAGECLRAHQGKAELMQKPLALADAEWNGECFLEVIGETAPIPHIAAVFFRIIFCNNK